MAIQLEADPDDQALDALAYDYVDIFCGQLKDFINTRFPDAAICVTVMKGLEKLVTDDLQ